MKRIFALILSVVFCLFCFSACNGSNSRSTSSEDSTDEKRVISTSKNESSDPVSEPESVVPATSDEENSSASESIPEEYTPIEIDPEATYSAVIKIKDYGEIVVLLDQSQAPITVENFVNLASSGFYDGLTFHRIIEGFMMQGGCPNGDGYGNSGKFIKGEFLANGIENNISHKRGVISMARSNHPDSASSQFFIMHQDNPGLDGMYAAFGYVIAGIEIVDAICEDSLQVVGNNGAIPAASRPIMESVRIIIE